MYQYNPLLEESLIHKASHKLDSKVLDKATKRTVQRIKNANPKVRQSMTNKWNSFMRKKGFMAPKP